VYDLFELLAKLLGPGFVVRAHYGAYVPGAIADSGVWEHDVQTFFTHDDDDHYGTTSGVLFADIHAQDDANHGNFTIQRKITTPKHKQTNKGA
jgi:hypothetical protein